MESPRSTLLSVVLVLTLLLDALLWAFYAHHVATGLIWWSAAVAVQGWRYWENGRPVTMQPRYHHRRLA